MNIPFSLFPSKGDFQADHFEDTICRYDLQNILATACQNAWRSVYSYELYNSTSRRCVATMMHEAFFAHIEQTIQTVPFAHQFDIHRSTSGNEREFFRVGDYIFIIKHDGSNTNETNQQERIEQQSVEQHIITIVYTIDAMRTSIAALNLDYRLGGQTLYRHAIPLQSASLAPNVTTTAPITPTAPTLKTTAQKAAQ